jgi:hypothetical protein
MGCRSSFEALNVRYSSFFNNYSYDLFSVPSMKYSLTIALCFAAFSDATHNIVVMGSSYAFGAGLTGDNGAKTIPNQVQNYGYKLAQKLGTLNSDSFVHNLAQSGSWLNYVQSQAPNIPSDTTLIAMTSGGNDMDYIGCLTDTADNPASTCVSPTSGMTEVRNKFLREYVLTVLRQCGRTASYQLSRL